MKKIFITLLLLTFALAPVVIFAADPLPVNESGPNTTYTLLEPLPCVGSTSNCKEGDIVPTLNIKDYLTYVFNLSLALAAFLAVIMIVWNGFVYMTSEVVGNKSEAIKGIQGAVGGLVLALSSYLILKTINPQLVRIEEVAIPQLQLSPQKIAPLSALDEAVGRLDPNSAENKRIAELKKTADTLDTQAQAIRQQITDGNIPDGKNEIELTAEAIALEQKAREARGEASLATRTRNVDILSNNYADAVKNGDKEDAENELQKIKRQQDQLLSDPNLDNNPALKQTALDQVALSNAVTKYKGIVAGAPDRVSNPVKGFLFDSEYIKKGRDLIESIKTDYATQVVNLKTNTAKDTLYNEAQKSIDIIVKQDKLTAGNPEYKLKK